MWSRGTLPTTALAPAPASRPAVAVSAEDVAHFCGDCHRTPDPAAFPGRAWRREVERGFEFYYFSERRDLKEPPLEGVVAWFTERAPDEVEVRVDPARFDPSPVSFRRQAAPEASSQSALSHVRWYPEDKHFVICNMWTGMVARARTANLQLEPLASVLHPAHAEPVDLNGDGRQDLVVADLGSFQPSDHARGAVVWLKATDQGFESQPLATGLGRVADVRPGDFDGDGDLDLVVAEFGWRSTGRILLLRNAGTPASPRFDLEVVDPRHGTIHVLPVDLDGDGNLDFVALISQEHETVVAFLNDGTGRFRQETVGPAGDPALGSSGIELLDLDQDGDLDVLMTAGDTFDSPLVKPFHGILWLENEGRYPFTVHELAVMPGVHRALAGDLDGDGDLDIVACALLPEKLEGAPAARSYDSLIWLEQRTPGRFVPHRIDGPPCRSAAMAMGDFDGDEDLDLAVGAFSTTDALPPLTVWWNEGASASVRPITRFGLD